MRVLFVSDVYFPRVNGVSTSIRTFRADLARLGVETMLVAPEYPGAADGHRARHHSRAFGRRAAAIPKTGAFIGGPLKRVLECRARRASRPGAHPHAVHRALRRACVSRAQHGLPRGRDLSHLLRGLPASLRADPAARHRPLPRAALHALAMRRRRRADFAQRADARRLAGLRRHDAHRSAADGTAGREFRAAATARASASDSGCRPTGRCCCTWAAWPSKRTSTSCCACSCACARGGPMRCS